MPSVEEPPRGALYGSTDAVFIEHLARGAAPAASWGVFDSTGVIHERAVGIAPSAAFRIASCTESFTAAALLTLRDEGLLHLDEPITQFVPGLILDGLPSPASAVPTLRMLLTMSGGLPTDDPWADRQEAQSAEEFDAVLAAGVRFESEPGTRFAYSNLGYALLGRAIEVAAGAPFRRVVEQRLIEPLELTGTAFDTSVTASGGMAIGHRRYQGAWEALPFTGPGAFSAIGGLFSTVSDLARWARWLNAAFADAPESSSDAAVLSAASRREMQQLHRLDQSVTARPTGYGYGLFVEQYSPTSRVVSHSGGYPGFSAHMRWSVEQGLGVDAFENATYSRVSDATGAAFNDLLTAHETRVAGASQATTTLWSETRDAQKTVNELLASWLSETGTQYTSLSQEIFSENVELDEPLERRVAAFQRCAADIGGLTTPVSWASSAELSEGPAHLVWFVVGASGRLRVEIRMTPEAQPRVQTLLVATDRLGRLTATPRVFATVGTV